MSESTVEITAEEYARLRETETREETTRERSPIKPQDHRPAIKDARTVHFEGETYTFDVRAAKDVRTMFALRDDDMRTVLVRVIGEDGLEQVLKSIEDEDGYADFERLAEFVGQIYEKAGSKNS